MQSLNLIWQQAQTGDRLAAKRELAGLLREQPGNVQGWLLMATLLDDPAQQADCYRKVLGLDPQNRRAATMLQQLSASEVPSREEEAATTQSSPVSAQIPELFEFPTDAEADEEFTAAMTRADLAEYVARELGSGADRNSLIRYVCETGEMSWREAEMFVARVALENRHAIAKRQGSLMLVLSIATLVGGVILFLAGGYMLVLTFSGDIQTRPDFGFYGIMTGMGMVAGGLIGLVRTLKSLRDASD